MYSGFVGEGYLDAVFCGTGKAVPERSRAGGGREGRARYRSRGMESCIESRERKHQEGQEFKKIRRRITRQENRWRRSRSGRRRSRGEETCMEQVVEKIGRGSIRKGKGKIRR